MAHCQCDARKSQPQYFIQTVPRVLSLCFRQVFLTVELLNIITGSHEQSQNFWNERLLPSVLARFGELAVDHAEGCNVRFILQPCIMHIIQRIQVGQDQLRLEQDLSNRATTLLDSDPLVVVVK